MIYNNKLDKQMERKGVLCCNRPLNRRVKVQNAILEDYSNNEADAITEESFVIEKNGNNST